VKRTSRPSRSSPTRPTRRCWRQIAACPPFGSCPRRQRSVCGVPACVATQRRDRFPLTRGPGGSRTRHTPASSSKGHLSLRPTATCQTRCGRPAVRFTLVSSSSSHSNPGSASVTAAVRCHAPKVLASQHGPPAHPCRYR
jgi:hypothetical protein